MIQLVLLVLLFTPRGLVSAQNSCETDRLNAVKNGQQKVQGVNLGSWFVLEAWIAGYLWDDNGCDKGEYQGSYLFEQCVGDRAKSVMENHWSTWITEDDFAEMSRRGINVARIPVGWWHIYDTEGGADHANLHWNVNPRNYVAGGLTYLDNAFEWGKKHGVGILIDLHAAPGSQNGYDHSSPSVPGEINWDKTNDNVGQSIDSMELYAERYGNHEALFGFALLNEPVYLNLEILQNYYKNTYDVIRRHSPDSYIILNPQLIPWDWGNETYWVDFMNPDQGYTKVGLDFHLYACYGGLADTDDADANINYVQKDRVDQIADYQSKNPKLQIIGEFSNCQHGDQNRNPDFLKKQVEIYSTTSLGFTFWTWKVPDNDPWSLRDEFSKGWMDSFDHPC